jgi:hypothetical protein
MMPLSPRNFGIVRDRRHDAGRNHRKVPPVTVTGMADHRVLREAGAALTGTGFGVYLTLSRKRSFALNSKAANLFTQPYSLCGQMAVSCTPFSVTGNPGAWDGHLTLRSRYARNK